MFIARMSLAVTAALHGDAGAVAVAILDDDDGGNDSCDGPPA